MRPSGFSRVKPLAGTATAGLLLLLLTATGLWLHEGEAFGSDYSFTLLMGALFGFILQRSRFCFFCIFRETLDEGEVRGLLAVFLALAVGSLGYQVVFGAWVPDPSVGYLPPNAHIGPVSWVLVVGGLVFGMGMALSGACISAHLYRLGEGYLLAPLALAGSAAGFGLGFLAWNTLYLRTLMDAPVVWLPADLGYAGSLALQLGLLGLLTLILLKRVRRPERTGDSSYTPKQVVRVVFVDRWPAWTGGLAVGLLSTGAFLRTEPLGVTAELGRVSRRLFDSFGLLPARLEGLDGFRGCSTVDTEQVLTLNALFVGTLVVGSLGAALAAGQFRPRRQPLKACLPALLGGVLLGFGAMLSLGCTVGTFLSGVHAFALSGWLFGAACLTGVWGGLKLRRRLL